MCFRDLHGDLTDQRVATPHISQLDVREGKRTPEERAMYLSRVQFVSEAIMHGESVFKQASRPGELATYNFGKHGCGPQSRIVDAVKRDGDVQERNRKKSVQQKPGGSGIPDVERQTQLE